MEFEEVKMEKEFDKSMLCSDDGESLLEMLSVIISNRLNLLVVSHRLMMVSSSKKGIFQIAWNAACKGLGLEINLKRVKKRMRVKHLQTG